MHPQSLEISDPELARWLVHLDTLKWTPVVYRNRLGAWKGREEYGGLSEEEWNKVREVIASGNVMLTLHDYQGSRLYVSLWSYPVSKFEEIAVRLLTIGNKHLEHLRISSGLYPHAEYEGLWGIVYPFTHSKENIAAVQAYLPDHQIMDLSQYEY